MKMMERTLLAPDESFDAPKNPGERFRRVYSYRIDGDRADMMAVLTETGTVLVTNCDNDCYFETEKKISEYVLELLTDSTEQAALNDLRRDLK